MPAQDRKDAGSPIAISHGMPSYAYPSTLTPPPDAECNNIDRPTNPPNPDLEPTRSNRLMYVNNNTGAAMASSQEESMYMSPEASPLPIFQDAVISTVEDMDKMSVPQDDVGPSKSGSLMDLSGDTLISEPALPLSPRSLSPSSSISDEVDQDRNAEAESTAIDETQIDAAAKLLVSDEGVVENVNVQACHRNTNTDVVGRGPKIDEELDWSATTIPWDFTHRPLTPRYPSAMFQCNSTYAGTQQSDRQTYNVYVRILTVDMDQCNCTGYLTIKGLTPEHETLQTYFTGEIIGGPESKYGFRTKTSQWGASDKTDLTHWARFPAWRSYAAHTKKNLDFQYPPMGEDWWQQEHIFMRWKEHFLVPDHKTKSIAGASFEGFYYICLNQVAGRISGIYFHSKSEKYQQLELNHEGPTGIWHRGLTPCVEFR